MKAVARSLVVILVALIAVPALAVSVTLTTAVQLLATTALIMGGTQHPLSPPTDSDDFVNNYFVQAENNYIRPGPAGPSVQIRKYAVTYPAEFFPTFGTLTFEDSVAAGRLNLGRCLGVADGGACAYNTSAGVNSPKLPGTPPQPTAPPPDPTAGEEFIVFGYSQSAVVASLVKQDLIDEYSSHPEDSPDVSFVMVSNPSRQNGGVLGRGFEGFTIPIIGIPFYGPTANSCPSADPCTAEEVGHPVYYTTDVAQQYDFLGGDAPARLDPLAFANSIAAYALLHGNMPTRTIDGTDPEVIFQDTYGDTDYYMVTAPRLPLLMLLEQAGVPGPVLALPDALLRVWIEDKYRRDLSPGEHVQWQLAPIGNPVALVGNMLGAIPVGIDDTVQQAGGGFRPLGTADVYRPFGVGGPVYDKQTGERTTDNIGIPTGAGDYDDNSLQTLAAPETGDNSNKLTIVPDASEINNGAAAEGPETPEAIRPKGPFAELRESLDASKDNAPFGIRPNGEGPLKRIVNALTGQRPKADAAPEADKKPAESESPAA